MAGANTGRPPVGLALAGGAPSGAIYEIGALRALDEALVGLDLTNCDVYVGVSAGGFLAACLANGVSTAQQCRAIVKHEPGEHPFKPEIFFQPAFGEVLGRLGRLPGLLGGALGRYVTQREKRLRDALTGLGGVLPVAIFANEPIREYVAKIFSIKGRTDDFNRLAAKLTVVTTDIESGRAMRFGAGGWAHVPISRAVQASTALPGLYPPVEINGRAYVDGILLKTLHTSVALEGGAQLIFCINPVVPVDTRKAVQEGTLPSGPVVRQGLPSVMSQTVRTLIHSRMRLGFRAYDSSHPESDVVLLEPRRDDHENFFSNIFSFASRRAVCERAYLDTRRELRRRAADLEPVLERYGLALDHAVLADEERDVWASVGVPELSRVAVDPEPLHDPAADVERLDALIQRVERLATDRA